MEPLLPCLIPLKSIFEADADGWNAFFGNAGDRSSAVAGASISAYLWMECATWAVSRGKGHGEPDKRQNA